MLELTASYSPLLFCSSYEESIRTKNVAICLTKEPQSFWDACGLLEKEEICQQREREKEEYVDDDDSRRLFFPNSSKSSFLM